jgi:acetoacetate decarboxylase
MAKAIFIPEDKLINSISETAMDDMEGIYAAYMTTPEAVRKYLPPCFKVSAPIVSTYVVNVGKPAFSAQYNEAGISIPCSYGDKKGVYYVSLMLTGPGAEMAMHNGREFWGFPKKMADDIRIERRGSHAHAYIERGGARLFDIELELGDYNSDMGKMIYSGMVPGKTSTGCAFLIKYGTAFEDGKIRLVDTKVYENTSESRNFGWEGGAVAITLDSTDNDPWGELPVVQNLGGGWSRTRFEGKTSTPVAELDGKEIFPFIYSGRYDSCFLTGYMDQTF